jgi:hypothetical protein
MNGMNTGAITCGAFVEDQPHATWSIYMRFTIILLASVAFAGAALADSNHTCVGNANCSTTNNDNDTYNTTNKGGTGIGVGIGYGEGGDGGNATIARGAVNNENENTNKLDSKIDNKIDNRDTNTVVSTNVNAQSQGQEQQQKQSLRNSNSSRSSSRVDDSGNSSVYIEGDRYPKIPVASAIAPSASGNCQSFLGGAGQGISVGASGLIPISSNWCRIVNMMNWVAVNVSKQAAIRYGCISEDDFAEAVGEAMCNAPDQPVTDMSKVSSLSN